MLHLVPCLNIRYHVSHRACNLILNAYGIIMEHLGLGIRENMPVGTLRPAVNSIGLAESSFTLPMCPNCRRVFLHDSPLGLKCFNYFISLFRSKSSLQTDFDGTEERSEDRLRIPVLRCPFYPLGAQLPAFIRRFENELENSLLVTPEDGLLRDVRRWQILEGSTSF